MKPSLKTLSANIRTKEQVAREQNARAMAMSIQAAAAIRRTLNTLDRAVTSRSGRPTIAELNSIRSDLAAAL